MEDRFELNSELIKSLFLKYYAISMHNLTNYRFGLRIYYVIIIMRVKVKSLWLRSQSLNIIQFFF